MSGKFNLNDLLNSVSKSKGNVDNLNADNISNNNVDKSENGNVDKSIKYIDVDKLKPSEKNFYSINDIEEIKDSIELTGKILQALIVTPLENGDYKILSGHRRHRAILSLMSEGKEKYRRVPCVIEELFGEQKKIKEELILIAANSQREKTPWDKVEEAQRTRALLEDMKRFGVVKGNLRKKIAEALNTSSTQIGRYDAISRNLEPSFIESLKNNEINISVAYELSGLNKEEQEKLYEEFKEFGDIDLLMVQKAKEKIRKVKGSLGKIKSNKEVKQKLNREGSNDHIKKSITYAIEYLTLEMKNSEKKYIADYIQGLQEALDILNTI